MSGKADAFIDILDRRQAAIVDACTRCGKCVEACPTPALTGIDAAPADAVAGGVIDILNGAAHIPESETWARVCCGTGHCIDACPEGIDARFMLTLARRALGEMRDPEVNKADGRKEFQAMSRGVRILSRLQMPPDVLARLNPSSSHAKPAAPPDVIFYTGCNLLKTPHIGLLCLDVMDRLGLRYEVMGGPGNCCGVLQLRPGDTGNAGRQIMTTLGRFQDTGAADVIAWCPTCQIQFAEITMPGMEDDVGFDMSMWPVYLAARLDALKPMMTTPVKKKVALCEFPGARGVPAAVRKLMNAIPGLTLVDLGIERAGYQMSAFGSLQDYRQRMLADLFRAAEAAGVDTLAGIFHADHRELASHQDAWPFEIVNYMDLIGESLGIRQDDVYKRLKLMGDADAIVAEAADTLAANGVTLEDARDAVLAYMLGDQLLSPDRSKHPSAAD